MLHCVILHYTMSHLSLLNQLFSCRVPYYMLLSILSHYFVLSYICNIDEYYMTLQFQYVLFVVILCFFLLYLMIVYFGLFSIVISQDLMYTYSVYICIYMCVYIYVCAVCCITLLLLYRMVARCCVVT